MFRRNLVIISILICGAAISATACQAPTTLASTPWSISLKRQAEIKHLLAHDCGSCHGITLKGGLGPPITAQALKNKADIYLFNTIQNGLAGTPMPPWSDFFNDAEIYYLLELLRSGELSS